MAVQPRSESTMPEDQLYFLAGDAAIICGWGDTAIRLYQKSIDLVPVTVFDHGWVALVPDPTLDTGSLCKLFASPSYSPELLRRHLPEVAPLVRENFSEEDSRTTSINEAVMQLMAL